MRGLEDRTDSERSLKAILRIEAWNAVLDEQEVQYDMRSPDSNAMLRKVYQTFSIPASRIAQQKALKDAMEAGFTVEATGTKSWSKVPSSSPRATSMLPSAEVQKNSVLPHAA